jgi:hypothetical protein
MSLAHIVDLHGNVTDLTWTGVKHDSADFGTLGFDEPLLGPLSDIKSVTLSLDKTGVFKEEKQIDFSLDPTFTSGVPEPSTWTMILLGFAGLGLMYSRTGKRTSAADAT